MHGVGRVVAGVLVILLLGQVGGVQVSAAVGQPRVDVPYSGVDALRPDVEVPNGPFVQPGGRADVSVPGESRTPVKLDVPKSVEAPGTSEPLVEGQPVSEAPAAVPGVAFEGPDGPLDESTELFTADNGERGIRVSPVRRWYQSKSGEWSEIDVKLALERGSKNVVVSSGDRVGYRFGPTSDGVLIDDGQGGTLGFRPVGAKVDPVVGDDGRSVTYPEVWPGVDLVYAVSPAGLKEDVVIKRPQLLSEFDFVVTGAEVAPIDRLEDGTALMPGTMEVRNAGKSVGLTVLPPVATDATGAPVFQDTSGMALKIDAGERRGGDQVLSVSADPKWLGSLSADEFPVRLDPLVGIGSGATAWVTLAMYRPTGLFGAQCTSASAGCNQSVGYATGYNFRTNIGFNLAPMWATVAAHPGVQISNARFVAQGASAAELWGARAPIPIGSELNYYIADLLPGMGDTIIGAGGTGIMDVTSFLQVWRVAREGGDTYFDSPMVAYVGNEAGPSWTQFPVSWLEVYFVNRAPSVSQVSPAPVSSSSLPTVLTASGSDPDGDPIQYQFTICDYNGSAESFCEDSAWQSGNSISLSAFSKVIYWNNMYTWRVKVRDGSGAHGYSETWWFHASLPDPGFPSWRGGDDPYSGFAGGVNLATGNYFATQTDASVSSLGSTLDVERSYNSLDTRVGLFGQGWSSVFDTRLDAMSGPGGVWLYRPDGRSEFYGRNSNGTFQSPFGYGSTLAYSGSKYTLTEVDGTITEFANSGVITLRREPLGQETRFVWSGGSPVSMSSYTSSSASVPVRTLTFTTTTSGSNVLVTSVKTESVTGQGQLTWSYGYTGTKLVTVNDPINPVPSTVRTTYAYDTSGRLTKWTRPGTAAIANTTEIELDYNAAGKVAWRKDGVGSQYTYA
ncbi:MAG: hypothetical protein GX868_05280, partial [Actinobacteria bacterium]|nr:hypothetical protein [Actinomycetota bacterium]